MTDFDMAVIGGGLNGVSVARDAAGRGIRVVLFEQDDIGGGATAASSGLMQGRFIDLERGACLQVRKALTERDLALRAAPHLVRPARYVVPVHGDERPPASLRASLFLYDRLAPRGFHQRTTQLDLTHHAMGVPLKRAFGAAFEHSDCISDDTRLASLAACDAALKGATILTGARCVRAERSDIWRLSVVNRGRREVITARSVVNASGGWINSVAETVLQTAPLSVAFRRSAQIVVPRMYDHENVYELQHKDRSIIYTVPYQNDFTLVGSVTETFSGDPAFVAATSADVLYLCQAANRYVRETIEPSDVVRATAGVYVVSAPKRSDATMRDDDSGLHYDRPHGKAPLLSLYGGAAVTARRRAEAAVDRLAPFFVASPPWTSKATVPGGDFAWDQFDDKIDDVRTQWPFLDDALARRLFASYGTRVGMVLGDATSMDDLGPAFGPHLRGAEVRYLMRHEHARFADDILWRRSKLGLTMPQADRDALAAFMAANA